ncbi:hypothetical protein ES703_82937 [subsurface metagenome]
MTARLPPSHQSPNTQSSHNLTLRPYVNEFVSWVQGRGEPGPGLVLEWHREGTKSKSWGITIPKDTGVCHTAETGCASQPVRRGYAGLTA